VWGWWGGGGGGGAGNEQSLLMMEVEVEQAASVIPCNFYVIYFSPGLLGSSVVCCLLRKQVVSQCCLSDRLLFISIYEICLPFTLGQSCVTSVGKIISYTYAFAWLIGSYTTISVKRPDRDHSCTNYDSYTSSYLSGHRYQMSPVNHFHKLKAIPFFLRPAGFVFSGIENTIYGICMYNIPIIHSGWAITPVVLFGLPSDITSHQSDTAHAFR